MHIIHYRARDLISQPSGDKCYIVVSLDPRKAYSMCTLSIAVLNSTDWTQPLTAAPILSELFNHPFRVQLITYKSHHLRTDIRHRTTPTIYPPNDVYLP
jgi:hypothetical protein